MKNKLNFLIIFTFSMILVLIIAGMLLPYKNLNFRGKNSNQIMKDRLLSDVKIMNLEIEAVQRVAFDASLIIEFQDVDMDEFQIIANSVLLNNPEIFGVTFAFEPYRQSKDSQYFAPFFYNQNDTLSTIWLKDDLDKYFNQDWYLVPKTLNKPVWSEPYYLDFANIGFVTTYSVPVYKYLNDEEVFIGVVALTVSLEWLSENMDKNLKIPFDGIALLITENGTIVRSKNREWVFNETIYTIGHSLKIPQLRKIGRDIKQGIGQSKISFTVDREDMVAYYSTIKANNWGIVYVYHDKNIN